MLTNVIIEDVSFMVDTEKSDIHFSDGSTGIYVKGFLIVDKEGNVVHTNFEQEDK